MCVHADKRHADVHVNMPYTTTSSYLARVLPAGTLGVRARDGNHGHSVKPKTYPLHGQASCDERMNGAYDIGLCDRRKGSVPEAD
jgi:hypothetical protein